LDYFGSLSEAKAFANNLGGCEEGFVVFRNKGTLDKSKRWYVKKYPKGDDTFMFTVGDVWVSPNGWFHKVMKYSKRGQAVLRKGIDGDGVHLYRDRDATRNWTYMSEEEVEEHKITYRIRS
jgi:hypothetical protein